MRPDEWESLAKFLGGLWAPALDGNAKAAYYEVLESFTVAEVRTAIETLSRTTREKRPPAGVIYTAVRAEQDRQRSEESSEAPARDVLTPAQHRMAQIEIAQLQTAEHARRMKAVLALGRRLSFATLTTLLPLSSCSAEEFDRRLAKLAEGSDQPLAAAASDTRPGRSRRTLLSSDPEGEW